MVHALSQREYDKLSTKEKKKYPYSTAVGNKREIVSMWYFKTKKDQLAADKESGLPVGDDWSDQDIKKRRNVGNWMNYF